MERKDEGKSMNNFFFKLKSFIQKTRWICIVSKRFANVDKNGKGRVTGNLAVLGICFGVMTLITVLSVMNGFQKSSILPLMELSSAHIQVSDLSDENYVDFIDYVQNDSRILCCTPFYEAQSLMTAAESREACAIVRAVDENIMEKDIFFKNNITMLSGTFDLSEPDSVVLGYSLAKESLGVIPGSYVNLFALSGSKDLSLISNDRKLLVKGIFSCGYLDIDQTFAFVGLNCAKKYLGKTDFDCFAIKLNRIEDADDVKKDIKNRFDKARVLSWKDFNKTFYNTLKIEKNILILLVLLIFIVVGINIYNGMRRIVFERSIEISTLQALGGTKKQIKAIFVFRGFMFGLKGTLIGLLLAIVITLNMSHVFDFIAKLIFYWNYGIAKIFNPDVAQYVQENSMFSVYASIPAVIQVWDVVLVCVFGLLSPFIASERAGANILKMNVQEVLHNE